MTTRSLHVPSIQGSDVRLVSGMADINRQGQVHQSSGSSIHVSNLILLKVLLKVCSIPKPNIITTPPHLTMTSTQRPSQLIAATKGIAIAASFITTGSLLTNSNALIPSILHSSNADEISSAHIAAQQFALGFRGGSKTLPPAEIIATAAFSFLAYHSYQIAHLSSTKWKLYAGAAAAMFSVIPYTLFLMQEITLKLVQLADAPPHTASTSPSLTHKPQGGMLGVPGQSAVQRPAITPAEEFEPFDDSPFSAEEYERAKVQKMLKQWNTRNTVRIVGPLVAGILGLWAMLAE
jgi:hypothetical protein